MWLRPEAALFLAISAHVLHTAPYRPSRKPSLDLGAGNGLFSFLAAGGSLTPDYDYYTHAGHLDKFWKHADIYDHFAGQGQSRFIARMPDDRFTYAYDHKENLKKQADLLNFYDAYGVGDANKRWPYPDGELQSVFSNIFYWLDNPRFLFPELARVLAPRGKAFLALQDPSFPKFCPSYQTGKFPKYADVLKLLNRGRADSSLWRLSLKELEALGKKNGLKLVYHRRYLTDMVLKIWDIGLRPFSPVLIRMANSLSAQDRLQCKKEWVDICVNLLRPIYESEKDVTNQGGYLYLIFEKQ